MKKHLPMRIVIFVSLCIFLVSSLCLRVTESRDNKFAQDTTDRSPDSGELKCLTNRPTARKAKEVREVLNLLADRKRTELASDNPASLTRPSGTVIINVYFHVIQKRGFLGISGSGFIPITALEDQVGILNSSFSGALSGGNGLDTPFRFQLAGHDYIVNDAWFDAKQGSAEERQMKQVLRVGGPKDLNIFTTNGAGAAGWSSFPWELYIDSPMDGVVLNYKILPSRKATGLIGVHEVGHWLGLYHTFETATDNDVTCGALNDEVSDTPAEQQPNFGCPQRQSDTCASVGLDPVHNFMTYRSESCMNQFTVGQGFRMDLTHFHYRESQPSVQYLSFVEGDPNVPADGRIVSAVGGEVDIDYNLTSPFSLAGAIDGFTVTVFPSTNLDFTVGASFGITNQKATEPCSLSFGAGGTFRSNVILVKNVRGYICNIPPHFIASWVAFANQIEPGCNITASDLYIDKIFFPGPVFGQQVTNVDAVAVGYGQNNTP